MPNISLGIFAKELKDIATVVAKEAVVSVELKRGVQVKEVYGYRFSKGETVVAIPMGDIYAGRNAEVLMKLNVPASSGNTQLVDVKVSYHDALAGEARRVKQTLAATFIDDTKEVERSANVAVFTKAEKVRTAEAMKRASQEAKAGRRGAARAGRRAHGPRRGHDLLAHRPAHHGLAGGRGRDTRGGLRRRRLLRGRLLGERRDLVPQLGCD